MAGAVEAPISLGGGGGIESQHGNSILTTLHNYNTRYIHIIVWYNLDRSSSAKDYLYNHRAEGKGG